MCTVLMGCQSAETWEKSRPASDAWVLHTRGERTPLPGLWPVTCTARETEHPCSGSVDWFTWPQHIGMATQTSHRQCVPRSEPETHGSACSSQLAHMRRNRAMSGAGIEPLPTLPWLLRAPGLAPRAE